MNKLIKKLRKNIKKGVALSVEMDILKTGEYWNSNRKLVTDKEKEAEELRIKRKQQKNLSKRFDILESLELEILKAKQDTSTKQRAINL